MFLLKCRFLDLEWGLNSFNWHYNRLHTTKIHKNWKTSQKLRMLSLSLFIQGSLWMLRLFFNCHCLCLFHSICHCLFVGQIMSLHHSDQKSQRSQVSRGALWGCFLNVFVIVFVFVIGFAFAIVFLMVRSCLFITLIKSLKGDKSSEALFEGVF